MSLFNNRSALGATEGSGQRKKLLVVYRPKPCPCCSDILSAALRCFVACPRRSHTRNQILTSPNFALTMSPSHSDRECLKKAGNPAPK